jgi:hypothetical protein
VAETFPELFAGPLVLESEDETRHLHFGDLDCWVRRGETEWRVATNHELRAETLASLPESRPPEEDAKWRRWVTGETGRGLALRPAMPDRSVVVRPESPVSILPGKTTDFYIGVPLWIQLSSVADDAMLAEIPSVKLSNTWFGEPVQGELCYAMRTGAYLAPADVPDRRNRAVCTIQVRNAAMETLSFERICLRCPHLKIFSVNGRFWANTTRLTHRGHNEWNRVAYAPGPPLDADSATLVADPRTEVGRGFLGKSLLLKLAPQI